MANTIRTQTARMRATLSPRVVRAAVRSGILDPRGALGLASVVPWLVGRGPSVATLVQINAFGYGTKTAVHDRWGSLTWRELDDRVNRLSGALHAYGLRPGEAVAALLRNGREMVETIAACQHAGLDVAPLNTWAKPAEFKHAIHQIRPRVLVYDTLHSELARSAADSAELVVAGDGADAAGTLAGAIAYEDLLAAHRGGRPAPVTVDRRRPKVIIHTSGTTGRAKAAARSSRSTGVGSLLTVLSVVPFRRDDTVLCPAPLFHSFGLLTFTLAAALGMTLILPPKFDPEETLALVGRHHATAASFVPVMIRRILALRSQTRKRWDLSSLRIVLASGSSIPPDLRRAAVDLFGPVLYDLYGSTEAGWVAVATPEDMRQDPRSLGRAVPGVEVASFSEDGRRLPPGELGTLHVRSPSVFEGYESGEAVPERDGFLSIGDIGWLDSDGRIHVEGRADDMAVVGGENVYPAEVEEVIARIPGVRDVAVIGVPDPEFGQVLAAFVAGEATADRIREACAEQLASFKVPRRIEIVSELPTTSTGKVLKRELAERPKGGRGPA